MAHQIANSFDEDPVDLAMGHHDPHEVCGYPDTGKVLVRAVQQFGKVEPMDDLEPEPSPSKIFQLTKSRKAN